MISFWSQTAQVVSLWPLQATFFHH